MQTLNDKLKSFFSPLNCICQSILAQEQEKKLRQDFHGSYFSPLTFVLFVLLRVYLVLGGHRTFLYTGTQAASCTNSPALSTLTRPSSPSLKRTKNDLVAGHWLTFSTKDGQPFLYVLAPFLPPGSHPHGITLREIQSHWPCSLCGDRLTRIKQTPALAVGPPGAQQRSSHQANAGQRMPRASEQPQLSEFPHSSSLDYASQVLCACQFCLPD